MGLQETLARAVGEEMRFHKKKAQEGMQMALNIGRKSGAAARHRLGACLFALAFAVIALPAKLVSGQDASGAAPLNDQAPIVFAAASMETALDAVAAAWKADTGKTVKISYGSSATLAKQIAQGAPADIFVSADLKWMDYLQTNKLIHPETRRNLFSNKLVLIEPSDADVVLEITKGFDLAGAAAKLPFVPLTRAQPEFTRRNHLNPSAFLRASNQNSRKQTMSEAL